MDETEDTAAELRLAADVAAGKPAEQVWRGLMDGAYGPEARRLAIGQVVQAVREASGE